MSGPDGAGKSTIIEDLRSELSRRSGRPVVILRHRPGMLPILSAVRYGRRGAEARAATRLPRKGTNRSRISSALRFAYYFSDYFVGQLAVYLGHTLRGHTVLYDRYYFDFIVDGRRTNLALDPHIVEWLYRFIFVPDLSVALQVDPEIVLQRKAELAASEIEELNRGYRALFERLQSRHRDLRYVVIDNTHRRLTMMTILDLLDSYS